MFLKRLFITIDYIKEYLIKVVNVFIKCFQFFHGCQFVYEEKFITQYNLSPLKAVGIEGNVFKQFTIQVSWRILYIIYLIKFDSNIN